MKSFTGLCAISSLLLSTAMACALSNAQPAFLSGKYAFVSIEMCEAKLTIQSDEKGVTSVTLNQSGKMSSSVGYITFTPTGPASGNARIIGSTQIEGGVLRVDTNGFDWSQHANNRPPTPYSFTQTVFSFGGENYAMVFGNVVNGIPQTVSLTRRRASPGGNASCLTSISLTLQ